MSKLEKRDLKRIKVLYEKDVYIREIAKIFKVSDTAIRKRLEHLSTDKGLHD